MRCELEGVNNLTGHARPNILRYFVLLVESRLNRGYILKPLRQPGSSILCVAGNERPLVILLSYSTEQKMKFYLHFEISVLSLHYLLRQSQKEKFYALPNSNICVFFYPLCLI